MYRYSQGKKNLLLSYSFSFYFKISFLLTLLFVFVCLLVCPRVCLSFIMDPCLACAHCVDLAGFELETILLLLLKYMHVISYLA